jgi:hypothetical protein
VSLKSKRAKFAALMKANRRAVAASIAFYVVECVDKHGRRKWRRKSPSTVVSAGAMFTKFVHVIHCDADTELRTHLGIHPK